MSKSVPALYPRFPSPSLKSRVWWLAALAMAINGGGVEWVKNGYGNFHCIDHYSLIQFLFWYERKVKEIVSKCNGLFVDGGANFGLFTTIAAKHGCNVLAIEPWNKAFSCLKDTIELNHIEDKVRALNMGAWSHRQTLRLMREFKGDSGRISVQGEPVQCISIDEALDGERPKLVKLDLEFSEPWALSGMIHTLRAYHPRVIFEAQDLMCLCACWKVLEPFGYRLQRLHENTWYWNVYERNWLATAN